jgi:Astacin (Peptidase family M12A)
MHSSCDEKKEIKNDIIVCGVPLNLVNNQLFDSNEIKPFAVIDLDQKWENPIIKVFFKDISDEAVITKTLLIANKWSVANIKFIREHDENISQIRISYRCPNDGYKSLIGKEADEADHSGLPTLWLNDLDKKPDSIFNRVVLHEFGHALGLFHEMQNPNFNLIWDSSVVYRYFQKNEHWTKSQVDNNIFVKRNASKYSKFDRESIMIYAIPDSFTKNRIAINWPNKLSKIDIENIKQVYQ